MSLSCVKNINTVASPKYCRVALQRMRPDKWNERRCVLLVSTHVLVKDVTTAVWIQQEFIYSFNSRTSVRYDERTSAFLFDGIGVNLRYDDMAIAKYAIGCLFQPTYLCKVRRTVCQSPNPTPCFNPHTSVRYDEVCGGASIR